LSKKSIDIARNSRISALKMVNSAKAAHIGSSLSCIDILSVLYSGVADIRKPVESRDFVIVSKGHAAAGTYSVLATSGHMNLELLDTYGTNGSELGGHVTHSKNDLITLSTGSLGHGLPYGIGIALSKKRKSFDGRVFILMSDGECDEGTTWESALLAHQFKLDNLFVIIDRNGIQSLSSTEDTLQLEPLAEKWNAFNWEVETIDGHSHPQIENAFKSSRGPKCIIANTTKGKGVSFMEGSVLWHYRPPSDTELDAALKEVGGNQNEK
jgi:transketolase